MRLEQIRKVIPNDIGLELPDEEESKPMGSKPRITKDILAMAEPHDL